MMKNHLIRWSVFFVCLLLASPVSARTLSNPFYPKSRAVLIAVDNYKHSDWKKMITPVADAKGLERFLKSRNFTVDTFYGKDATRKSIINYFEDVLPEKSGPQDRVVIFLAGHFYHRKKLSGKTLSFYVPYQGKDRRVGTMISLKSIKEWSNSLSARHVLLLVNGNWNNFSEEIVEKRFWKPRSRGYYRAASRKKSRHVLTAGYIGESFSESGPSGTPYSLFAGNLINSLETGATDIDHDGMIGASELAAYITEQVYQDAQQLQKPVFGNLSENKGGEIIFLSRKTNLTLKKALSKVMGTVKVTANIVGASISVDKKLQKVKTKNKKPTSIKLGIGKHKITLSKKYYLDTSAETFVSYEKTNLLKFTLKKDPTLKIGYMVPIKGGEYTIGARGKEYDNGPAHDVWVDDFLIGKYEVTNAEYMEFVKATGHTQPPCIDDESFNGSDKPVVCVSWTDAVAYCKWRSEVTGKTYRLPTEAEWEIAARGHSNRKYPWGDQLPKEGDIFRANYTPKEDGYACTAPVTSFEIGQTPNKIFHMGGNVYEWCSDWYDNSYFAVSGYRNPTGPEDSDSDLKVVRGGSWLFGEEGLYCTNRGQLPLQEVESDVGFRLVAVP